ncbi:ABC transporter ATP-binding protein [Succinivibrio dextrinosolvens]|uniref:ABC transporter ATP-binding protein n=1 Tax=Succinivibrio dextrinosolvens TaxID=83771 RepID=UPI001922E1F8|nr:ATP-binding cassette domain-containing protein [Succinivibrio dextrinosolvens]
MLELRDISFKVIDENGEKQILRNLNFTVEPDKLTVITGPNGSGKSTLAKIIMGIENPCSGQIIYKGQDITSMSITERARLGIGFSFQQPVKIKGMTVYGLLNIAAGRKGLTREQACGYLCEVGLCVDSYLDRELDSSLSGGELKRIEIASILAKAPKLALFDEPEAGIDLWSFQKLTGLFSTMRNNLKGGAMLIISHQERIMNIADNIAILSNGVIENYGSRKEILPGIIGTSQAEACPNQEIMSGELGAISWKMR